jgi:PAS domain S-box-containing protein
MACLLQNRTLVEALGNGSSLSKEVNAMFAFYVALIYSAVNMSLATIILIKSRRNILSQFFAFCVCAISCLGFVAYFIEYPVGGLSVHFLVGVSAFLYSVFPFFFLHLMLVFVRRYEILRSKKIIVANYLAGIFSYSMVLVGLIPNPFATAGGISIAGQIYYVIWMSILFSIGVALLYSLVGGFAERGLKSNLLFVSLALLMLFLPTPFTLSVFSLLSEDNFYPYFISSTAALTILVYIVFRHKIMMNTPYQAMKLALETMHDVLIKTDLDFRIELAQGAIPSLLGYSELELRGKPLSDFVLDNGKLEAFRDAVQKGKQKQSSYELEVISKDGRHLQMDFSFVPVFINEEVIGFVGVGRNITEKKRLEEQLRQAQKMEILGTLAGGIAHDFNNILAIILANASLLERSGNNPERFSSLIQSITGTVERGAGMVGKLLTFARKTESIFKLIDIPTTVNEAVKILTSAFPKSIEIVTHMDEDIPHLVADVSQLNQAILNLCVNARDAMLKRTDGKHVGGILTVSVRLATAEEVELRFPGITAQKYVVISVTDTGMGIDEMTKRRIFEPFFTTKGPGGGTGLGLAVVYGVVKNHNGFVDVQSVVGEGASFSLYFPIDLTPHESVTKPKSKNHNGVSRNETVLLVEDEEMLLKALKFSLNDRGYHVLTATNGSQAVEIYTKHYHDIAFVLCDRDLPKLSGLEVYRRCKEINPHVIFAIATGFVDPSVKSEMLSAGVVGVIQKPYLPDDVDELIHQSITSKADLFPT